MFGFNLLIIGADVQPFQGTSCAQESDVMRHHASPGVLLVLAGEGSWASKEASFVRRKFPCAIETRRLVSLQTLVLENSTALVLQLTQDLSRPCLLGFTDTGGSSGAQGGCRDAATHPLEGPSTTTDAQALRTVKFTTLAPCGKFLVLVSVTSLGHLPLIAHVLTTEPLGSFRLPARGCSPSKGCSGVGEFQQCLWLNKEE